METNTLQSGIHLEQLIKNKTMNHLLLQDINIIYFGHEKIENINKQFIVLAEQIVRPNKYPFLGKTILRHDDPKLKPDSMVLGKQTITLKRLQTIKPSIFDLQPLYETIFHSFKFINKNTVKEAFEKLINDILLDLNSKDPNQKKRKNILLLNERALNETLSSELDQKQTTITSMLTLIRYMILFNIEFNFNPIDSEITIIYYNEKTNMFYPLCLEHKTDNKLLFNKPLFIKLLKDLNSELEKKPDDKILSGTSNNKVIEIIDEDTNKNHQEQLNILLQKLEAKDTSGNNSNNNNTTEEKENILKEIDTILKLYPGLNHEEKLKNIFTFKNQTESKTNGIVRAVENTEKKIKPIEKGLESLQEVYNGSIDLISLKEVIQKHTNQIFDPLVITKLTKINGINKQRTEMFEKLDTNIKSLMEALKQDPELNLEIKDITNKLVETNKDRYFEYKVKIKHDYRNTTKSSYALTFRIPAPVNDKYLKIGGNNYIMIQQLFPTPIHKVSNTVTRLYTHYNTTSVILKGSKLDNKDFVNIEKDFIDKLNISSSKKIDMNKKTLDKLEEYGCHFSTGSFLFSKIIF